MAKVSGIVKGFDSYGASLTNRMWAVSSMIEGAAVMSLWAHKFKKGMVYEDKLSRWSGAGNNLFRKHLQLVVDEKLPVKLVIATSPNPAAVDRGEDASDFDNKFTVRPELIGEVVFFDGDEFHIAFKEV